MSIPCIYASNVYSSPGTPHYNFKKNVQINFGNIYHGNGHTMGEVAGYRHSPENLVHCGHLEYNRYSEVQIKTKI